MMISQKQQCGPECGGSGDSEASAEAEVSCFKEGASSTQGQEGPGRKRAFEETRCRDGFGDDEAPCCIRDSA